MGAWWIATKLAAKAAWARVPRPVKYALAVLAFAFACYAAGWLHRGREVRQLKRDYAAAEEKARSEIARLTAAQASAVKQQTKDLEQRLRIANARAKDNGDRLGRAVQRLLVLTEGNPGVPSTPGTAQGNDDPAAAEIRRLTDSLRASIAASAADDERLIACQRYVREARALR